MAAYPGVKLRSRPARTYNTFQKNQVGANVVAGGRGWWNLVDYPNDAQATSACTFGGRLFIGGDFTLVGGLSRKKVAAIDLQTGKVITPFNFDFGAGTVSVVATDGAYLYVGGSFTAVGAVTTAAGRAIRGLVRFNFNGELDDTWNPLPNASPAISLIIFNRSRSTIYIYGLTLTSVNGISKTRVAEVSVAGIGDPTSFGAAPNGSVLAMALDEARGLVYFGGGFSNLGGGFKLHLGRTDLSGNLDAWAPAPDSSVKTILPDGQNVYVGGGFTNIGVTPVARNYAALLNDSGEALLWNPNANSDVNGLIKYREQIFVSGLFSTIAGGTRKGLAVIHDSSTWTGVTDLGEWAPDPQPDASVLGMILLDRTVFAFGAMTSASYGAASYVQKFPWPIFYDANTINVKKTGADANAGTAASPKLTLAGGFAAMDAAHRYVRVLDSGTYYEKNSVAYTQANKLVGGLFADAGQAPAISLLRGPVPGTFGARVSGRVQVSGATHFCYVSKAGDPATAARDDISHPFTTIAAAIAAASIGDSIKILDSETYIEDFSIGNKNLFIESVFGRLPTLQNAGGATHITMTGTGTLGLFGLIIADVPKATGQMFLVSCALTFWDCTVSGNMTCINISTTPATLPVSLNGSIFSRIGGQVFRLAVVPTNLVTLAIDNCSIVEACGQTTSERSDVWYNFANLNAFSISVAISRTRFLNSNGNAAVHFERPAAPTRAGGMNISLCVFEDNRPLPAACRGIETRFTQAHGVGSGVVVSDCNFKGLGAEAFSDFSQGYAGQQFDGTFSNLLMDRCGRGPTKTSAILLRGMFAAPAHSWKNITIIKPGLHGLDISPMANTNQGTTLLERFVVIGAPVYGIVLSNTFRSITTIKACLEQGSGVSGLQNNIGTGTTTSISYCTFEKGIAGNTSSILAGFLKADPRFLSTTDGAENVGLNPDSPAMDNYLNQDSQGHSVPLIEVTKADARFWVDGFIFEANVNLEDGVKAGFGLSAPVETSWCSFNGLGPLGLLLASKADSRYNLFAVNGTAINAADSGGEVAYNAGANCVGAFLVVAGTNTRLRNNTAYACQYGQFDLEGAIWAYSKNQVFSASTVLDYSGPGALTNSDVERISALASVSGTRRAPLFRDVGAAPDLRLQAKAAGNFFDSPALALGDDGQDAGAYGFFYGPTSLVWSLTEFMQNGWVNPYWVPRQIWLSKMVEDKTVGGITFSDAAASGLEFVFEWPEFAFMPDAQVEELRVVYEALDSGGECQLSFDGGTEWIAVIRLLSPGFNWRDFFRLPFNQISGPKNLPKMIFRVQPS